MKNLFTMTPEDLKSSARYSSMMKELRMGMNLIDHDEFAGTIKAISSLAAETVAKTLGPYAHTTIIDDGDFTYPTKDGWTVLSRIHFQDPTHNSIFNMLKNISFRIVDKVGDGTTTAMVTADHFMTELKEALEQPEMKQCRQADIVSALNSIRDYLVAELKKQAIQIAPDPDEKDPKYQEIYDVAYVSSNGNHELASIMQNIYQKTKNPNILVDMNGGKEITYEIQDGYRFDCSLLMNERYVNTSEGYYSTNGLKHMVVIFDHNVDYTRHSEMISFLTKQASNQHAACIIMAPYFDDVITSVISTTIQNSLKANPNAIPGIMMIQIPELVKTSQKAAMSDFAALAGIPITNATKVKIFFTMRHNESTDDDSKKVNDPTMQVEDYNYGTAQELLDSCSGIITDATIGKNFITLHHYNKESILYKERLAAVQTEYDKAKKATENSPTNMTKEYLDAAQRLNKLAGALGVIHVGGISDLERTCNKDVIDDTFLACRSAYENGIVPGLNMGVLTAIKRVRDSHSLSNLETAALDILERAYESTTMDILVNKYADTSVKTWKYPMTKTGEISEFLTSTELITRLETDILRGRCSSYDIVNECCSNSSVPKISNSVSTDIEILYGITSILGMILTSDQYLSISRMYDRTAAIRQQEAINDRTTNQKVESVMSAISQYVEKHDDGIFSTIAKFIGNY